MPTGYCVVEDVRTAAQEANLSGPFDTAFIEPAIESVSDWLRKKSGRHWYDSTGSTSDLVATSTRSATNVVLDVPSSPHRQDRQLFRDGQGVRYPVTHHGPYAKIPLSHAFVESVTTLDVRDRDGGVTDWTTVSDKIEDRGEDYYVLEEDQEGYGASYLYIRASSVGARTDYDGLLTLDYDYGLDAQDEAWQDVRRGVANLAAAQVVVEDNVLTSIPDNGQLVGVDTQYDKHVDAAIGRAWSSLAGYLEVPTA